MTESKLATPIKLIVASYNVSIVVFYVFIILSLCCILISDLVVTNLFMHSLPGMILLYLARLFTPKVFLHEISLL